MTKEQVKNLLGRFYSNEEEDNFLVNLCWADVKYMLNNDFNNFDYYTLSAKDKENLIKKLKSKTPSKVIYLFEIKDGEMLKEFNDILTAIDNNNEILYGIKTNETQKNSYQVYAITPKTKI